MQVAHRFDDRTQVVEPEFFTLNKLPYRLGDILLSNGHVSQDILRRALELKHQSDAPIGEILRENGWVSEKAFVSALAQQWRLGEINLNIAPPEPELLLDIDVADCLRIGCMPWRLLDDTPIIAVADPSRAKEAIKACGMEFMDVGIGIASRVEILSTLEDFFSQELEQAARETCPEPLSARLWNTKKVAVLGVLLTTLAALTAVIAPNAFFWVLLCWVLMSNFATAMFRITAVIARCWPEKQRADQQTDAVRLADRRALPKVTLLIGLLRENLVLPALLKHLAELNYPRERLEILFLLEEDDDVTEKNLAQIDPGRVFDVIKVPAGTLQTKPRALNYGLNFAQGEIVGILDAEDRPEPEQIRAVVETLHTAPPDVACVQGVLDFYNTNRNWFSRCFTIEYAVWFKVLLKGFQRLGLPIPLGGTTVYFRRSILEKIGAWDAHNVTEDADLGMRLCRYGYRTEVMASATFEEANARVFPWIRQRSRWIKGYVMTWAIHMRKPGQLLADLGWRGFAAFQIIFLGGVTSYLSIPLLWAMWFGALGTDLQARFGAPDIIWQLAFASMIFGQGVMVAVSVSALLAHDKRGLIPWVITLPLYWPIGALAALKAVVEVLFAPYYWDKTEHGSQSDQMTLNETSPSGPIETE